MKESNCESKIIRNAARCLKCGDTLVSVLPGDSPRCRCGALSISGGTECVIRHGNPKQYEELLELEDAWK